jgi:hypothetical protein
VKDLLLKIGPFLCVALVMVSPLAAEVIDFDAQAAGNGGNIGGIPDSPLIMGMVTLTGGELLNGEMGLNADQTGVYATEGLFGSGETNPLVITFASPVSGFSVFVVNADDQQHYTVSDNLGDSVTMSLVSAADLGAAIFSLSGNDVTSVDITSSDANAWNFAIDNVTFTPATPTPEPASLVLLGGSCILMGALRRKQLTAWLRLKK